MSKQSKTIDHSSRIVEAIFKDENDEPVLFARLPSSTTLRNVRKANPSNLSHAWVEFHVPISDRLEKIEFYSAAEPGRSQLSYEMKVGDLSKVVDDATKAVYVASTMKSVIAEFSELIRRALGTDSLAINWGGPEEKYVMADACVFYYLDADMAFFKFEREQIPESELESITLDEVCSRASVLCDHMDNMCESVLSRLYSNAARRNG